MKNRLGTLSLVLSLIAICLGATDLIPRFSGETAETLSPPTQLSKPPPLPPGLGRTVLLSPGIDFSHSIAEAVADVNADKIDEIRFLPGEYEMPGGLIFEKKFGQGGLRISGAGVGLTRLVFRDVPMAILVRLDTDIRPSEVSPAFAIEGLSLLSQGHCGTAVQLERRDQTRQGGIAEKRFSNLAVDGNGGSWDMGITAATGLPRETVRRKIARLVELGWVEETGRAEFRITPKVAEHFTPDFNVRLLDQLLQTADRIRGALSNTVPSP